MAILTTDRLCLETKVLLETKRAILINPRETHDNYKYTCTPHHKDHRTPLTHQVKQEKP